MHSNNYINDVNKISNIINISENYKTIIMSNDNEIEKNSNKSQTVFELQEVGVTL